MSVFRDLNKEWQNEWIQGPSKVKGENGESYLDRKALFINSKLEELEKNEPSKFSQYCHDLISYNDSNRKKWSIVSAALLGVEVGLLVPAALGVIASTPLWIGAVATAAFGYAVVMFKHRRYKRAYNICKVLRGDKKEIGFFRLFTKNKDDKHFVTMNRNDFVNSEEYPAMLKSSKIPPVIEKHFNQIYDYSLQYPTLDTETDKPVATEEYKPEFVKVEPKSEEEFEKETRKRARMEAFKVLIKRAVVAGIRSGISKAAENSR